MKNRILFSLLALVVGAGPLAACGSDGSGTDTGSGTHTLQVQGRVSWDAEVNAAELRVSVERAGLAVGDATVIVHSNLGDVTLTHDLSTGNGDYVGVQSDWAAYYALEVRAGEDGLSGSIAAPDLMSLVSPEPTVAIDAQQLPNNILTLRWSGDAADSVRVRSKDFQYEGSDAGRVDMPAVDLTDSSQDLELRRANSVVLAGGIGDSSLTATCENRFTLIVVNPY